MVSSLTAQLKDTRLELREKQKEKKEAERWWQNYQDDQEAEGRRLRDGLQSRDKLIEVKRRCLSADFSSNNTVDQNKSLPIC